MFYYKIRGVGKQIVPEYRMVDFLDVFECVWRVGEYHVEFLVAGVKVAENIGLVDCCLRKA